MASWKTIEPPSSFFASSDTPVEFHNCNDKSHKRSLEITGSYYELKGHSASSQMGIVLVESLRKNGSPDNQEGEADPVAQWRPRVSKLQLKGLSYYHSNEISVEEPDQGQWAE
jgi:hypothetical protein